MEITINDVLNIPYNDAIKIITEFIRSKVEEANAKGVAVGLSGGIDSAVAASLAVRALGSDRVTALILPDSRATPHVDVEDAIELAKLLNIRFHIITIDEIVDSFSIVPFFDLSDKIPTGNLRARIRMCILYYYANKFNKLVLGSGDRSELLIGYFTKYGDGAVDLLPLGGLYKTQVRRLGEILGVPEKIVKKPSSPRLWPDHMAEEELGMKYEEIDLVLYAIFDKGISPLEVPKFTGVSEEKVEKILVMHRLTRHKREMPPIPELPWIQNPLTEL